MRIVIEAWHADDWPGIVRCSLVDAHGRAWTIIDKAAVVSTETLSRDTSYPRGGIVRCEIVRRHPRAGREVVAISLGSPDGVAAQGGETHFDVFVDQLVDD